jgi:hypothetical protein
MNWTFARQHEHAMRQPRSNTKEHEGVSFFACLGVTSWFHHCQRRFFYEHNLGIEVSLMWCCHGGVDTHSPLQLADITVIEDSLWGIEQNANRLHRFELP